MRFLEELENAILDENFYKTNEVIEKIRENENAFEYLSYISEFCKKDSKNINHRWIANEIKNQFNKIGEIIIVTNGTMLPMNNSKELWEELSDSKVSVLVSDYGHLSKMKNELLNLCQKHFINVKILEKVFKDCDSQCRSLYNGELHFCLRSAHGKDLGIVKKRVEDYVDLLVEENDNYNEGRISQYYSIKL